MHETHFAPHPALIEYVDSVFDIDLQFTGTGLSPIYPFVPTHTRFLGFYLRDPLRVKKQTGDFQQRARSIIIGPQLTPVTLDLGECHRSITVVLKPAGMYRLLGIPMHELVECDHDARLVLGREIDDVLEQLQDADSSAARNDIIQRYLLSKVPLLRHALPFDRAMLTLVHNSGNLSMEQVAARAGISLRQLERQSRQRLGLPPKIYARMIRFSHAYKCKESCPRISWSDIAFRCGYFDQMHLIRDFKFFTGNTPGTITIPDVEHSVRFRRFEDLTVSFDGNSIAAKRRFVSTH